MPMPMAQTNPARAPTRGKISAMAHAVMISAQCHHLARVTWRWYRTLVAKANPVAGKRMMMPKAP